MIGLDLLQSVSHVLQRGCPVDGQPLTVLLDHGCRQAIAAVQCFIGETITVSNPTLVDGLVFEGHNAHHAVVFNLHDQVCTGAVMRAD